MAKLATQTIVIQLSKAVSESASDEIEVLDKDTLTQIQQAVEALVDDENGVIVELFKG